MIIVHWIISLINVFRVWVLFSKKFKLLSIIILVYNIPHLFVYTNHIIYHRLFILNYIIKINYWHYRYNIICSVVQLKLQLKLHFDSIHWFENKISFVNLCLWLTGFNISEENIFPNDFNLIFKNFFVMRVININFCGRSRRVTLLQFKSGNIFLSNEKVLIACL